ncbi:MAG TPA: hypothetical protein GX510_02520 [Firmicutes bacterium]|nr:hypothetical protein [Candidatus Fermentithermobacillaceae bacterium]
MDSSDLECARRGDADAFARLVLPLEHKMYQLALGITGNREDAEDAWQNTLVKAWRSLAKLREPGAFATWLTRIVLNEAKRVCRSRERQYLILNLILRHFNSPDNFPPDCSDILACIQELKPEQKEVILLRYWLDMPFEDIADIVGVPLNTAKTRLYRALEQLRSLLQGRRYSVTQADRTSKCQTPVNSPTSVTRAAGVSTHKEDQGDEQLQFRP